MAGITEQDRIDEFESIMGYLNEVEIATNILKVGAFIGQSCLMISVPTNMENWKEEYETDLHIATGYLMQLEEEDPHNKYLMIYMPIQVDLKDVDELTLYRFMNKINKEAPIGTCFLGEDTKTDRLLLQVKCMIGGRIDEHLDAGVVCEAVCELGYLYDVLKEQLLELVQNKA